MEGNLLQSYCHYTKLEESQAKHLLEIGAICERVALRFVIKSHYWTLLKTSDISTRSAIIHLSIEWNVSEELVKKIIYRTPQIKI